MSDDRRQDSSDETVDDDRRNEDRRNAPRIALEIWVEEVHNDAQYFRKMVNLSSTGFYVEKGIPHPLGTIVAIRVQFKEGEPQLELQAKITHVPIMKDGLGMGLQFIDLTADQESRINACIAEHISHQD